MKKKYIVSILIAVMMLSTACSDETVSSFEADQAVEQQEDAADKQTESVQEENEQVENIEETDTSLAEQLMENLTENIDEEALENFLEEKLGNAESLIELDEMSLEEDDLVMVGKPVELSDEQALYIYDDMPYYGNDWSAFQTAVHSDKVTLESGPLLWIGQTANFMVFGDETGLYINDKNYHFSFLEGWYAGVSGGWQPSFYERDFDNDGKSELLIVVIEVTGTEYHVRRSFVADEDENGDFQVYAIRQNWCMDELQKHLSVVQKEDTLLLIVDGEVIGEPVNVTDIAGYEEGDTFHVMPNRLEDVDVYENTIRVHCKLSVFADHSVMGTYPWNEAILTVDYQGAGKYELASCTVSTKDLPEIFEAEVDALESGTYYAVWSDATFEKPILILAKDIFEESLYNYRSTPMDCDFYTMDNGKLVSMGSLAIVGSGYPLRLGDGGVYVMHDHLVEFYVPDFATNQMVLKEGWYDDVVGPAGMDRPEGMDGYIYYDGTQLLDSDFNELVAAKWKAGDWDYLNLEKIY